MNIFSAGITCDLSIYKYNVLLSWTGSVSDRGVNSSLGRQRSPHNSFRRSVRTREERAVLQALGCHWQPAIMLMAGSNSCSRWQDSLWGDAAICLGPMSVGGSVGGRLAPLLIFAPWEEASFSHKHDKHDNYCEGLSWAGLKEKSRVICYQMLKTRAWCGKSATGYNSLALLWYK